MNSNVNAKSPVSSQQLQQQPSVSFKEMTSNARLRNYVRRNKEGSPEVVEVSRKASPPSINDASKDEDLRARGPIVLASSLDASECNIQSQRLWSLHLDWHRAAFTLLPVQLRHLANILLCVRGVLIYSTQCAVLLSL